MRQHLDIRRFLPLLVAAGLLAFSGVAFAGTAGDPPPDAPVEAPAVEPPPDIPDPEVAADPLADVKTVIRAAFRACLADTESVGFNQYLDLVHPERKLTGKAIRGIRRYSWNKFRTGCVQWIKDRESLDFVIARTRPPKVDATTTRVKVYFRAQHAPEGGGPIRYDAPMEFQKKDGRWMIWQNSL